MNAADCWTKTERTASSPTWSFGVWSALGVAVCLLALAVPLPALALSVAPTSLSFSTTPGGTPPAPQSITFWKGNYKTKNYTVSTTSPWVTVTPSAGTLASEQDQVTVSVNPSGLSGGNYTASVVIAMAGFGNSINQTTIPVSLMVGGTSSTPSISLNPSTLSFSAVAGGTAPTAQQINLTNPSGGTLSWTTSDNAAWLSLSTGSGTTTTETDSISATVNLTGLAAGTYTAAVTVSASGATNSPQVIPVSLTLTPAPAPTSNPIINLSVPSLTFTGTSGASNPSAQSFAISNTGTGTLTWTAGDNAAWLSLSPASGTNTGTVAATVNLAGLAAGTYSGTITVSATGATSKTLPVSFTVNPSTTAGSASLSWSANTDSDLAGYKVYVGTQSGVYAAPISVGQVTAYQLNNLAMNTTYFVSITAVDTAGNESLHSAEVSKSIF